MAGKYEKGLYDDYEKAINKLDAVLLELSNIRKEHKKEMITLKTKIKKTIYKRKERNKG